MHSWKRIGGAGAAAALCAVLGVALAATSRKHIVRTVQPGETVSLLCIELYGYYNAALGERVRTLNPSLKDINVIRPGDRLTFAAPGVAVDNEPAIERKLKVTQGVVTLVEGTAELRRDGESSTLTANSLVEPGDVIHTGADTRLEMVINRESVVRIGPLTRVSLEQLRDAEKEAGTTRVGSERGTIWTRVRKFKDRLSRFQLELPTAIAGVHGTVYQTKVNEDSSAEVKVYDGEVRVKGREKKSAGGRGGRGRSEVPGPSEIPGPHEVTMSEWTQIVRSQQRIWIDKKGKPSSPKSFAADPDDEWEQWNLARDRLLENVLSEI